jgi:uncharacterized membrane protein
MVRARTDLVRARTDLALVVALALAACLLAALIPPSVAVVRALVALPLVLVLPGYAIVAALFAPGALRTAEVVMLSLAASIASAMLAGLLLDGLAVRLTAAPWMALLAAITVVAAVRAGGRGHARTLVPPRVRLRAAEVGALTGALVLLSGAAVLGFTPLAPPKDTPGTSALWIVPAPGGKNAACVGVTNEELRRTSYTIQVAVAGGSTQKFGPITLAAGSSWSRVVAVGPGQPVVTATLRKAGSAPSAAPYRDVVIRRWNIAATSC